MSSGGDIYELRKWMYDFKDGDGIVTKEFRDGLEIFMYQAGSTSATMESGKMFCPCRKCMNSKYIRVENVWTHLYNRGFTPNYYIWYQHGEGYGGDVASTSNYVSESNIMHENENYQFQENLGDDDRDRVDDMVIDAFRETSSIHASNANIGEEPNIDAKRFYDMLDNANQPIYDGCREGLSKLSLAARMMNIKTDNNLSQNCMDSWAELIKEYLPEDNVAADSYYDIQKLVSSLGLPSEMIDVCVDNCMIFWKEDHLL